MKSVAQDVCVDDSALKALATSLACERRGLDL